MTARDQHPVPDRAGVNAFVDDPDFEHLLKLYLEPELFTHLLPHFHKLGALAGGRLDTLARAADINPPSLVHRSRSGKDEQTIVKHPAYQEMEGLAFGEYGLAAMSHRAGVLGWPAPMPAAAKYALTYLFVQAEFGLCCPLSMTDSLTRTLRKFGSPELIERYLARLTTQDMDALAQGAMFMTEQGAGSDVAATVTRAIPAQDLRLNGSPEVASGSASGSAWKLYGDKWFCSNPDAALAMVLARTEDSAGRATPGMKGVSLFLLPRVLPDGSPNLYHIIRLKDKLGTRSMASGEIRLEGAQAWLVGELGRGFVQMADMVNNSRLSNGMRAAGMMRRALSEALYIAEHRQAFGKALIDMPLMQRQLAKIMVPTEQARSMMFQAAEALRRSDANEEGAYALTRLLTPLLKFRACRDARKVAGDAMEVRGGCGYIEEWGDARILRDAHLGSIWEGTSNIVALDVMRAIQRENALHFWELHLRGLLARSTWHHAARLVLEVLIVEVKTFVAKISDDAVQSHARQAASAIYHLSSAVAMGWEASMLGAPNRMILAQLVLRHRLMPRAPLAFDSQDQTNLLARFLTRQAHAFSVGDVNLLTTTP